MKLDLETYRRLTSTVFAAALDPARWQHVLAELSPDGEMHCHLFGFDLERNVATEWVSHGYDPDAERAFVDHYHAIDPYPAVADQKGQRRVAMLRDLIPDDSAKRTPFYNEWMRPQNRLLGGGGIVLAHTETSMLILGTLIPESGLDRLEEECDRILHALVAPTRHAWAITRALAGGCLERAILSEGHGRDSAILVLDEQGAIVFSNRSADHRLAAGDVLRADARRRLRFASAEASRRLAALLAGLRAGPVAASFEIGGSAHSPAKVMLSRLDADEIGAWDLGLVLGIRQPSLLVVVSEREDAPDLVARLRRLHGLTPAEAEVAVSLSGGLTPAEIAEARAASRHTVRNQIKSATAKCGVRRQVELAALIARLGAE